ncbi:LysE family translocator [Kushneria phosphatilytica]|nr:LysE family transporter [Kushneria phosphatilytica]OHV07532.1 hypothetical protein BH688_15010 [Kushneria phosphatilytica]
MSQLTTLAITALLLFGSPGPGPMTIVATSATFGVYKTLSLYAGMLTGLAISMVASALGLAALLSAWPGVKLTLQIVGGLYVLYLAYRIATTPLDTNAAEGARLTMRDGIFLNVLNPKSYAVLLVVYSQFLLPISPATMAYVATMGVCLAVAGCTNIFWMCVGGAIRPLVQRPLFSRLLRLAFALLMIGAVFWAFIQS